MAACVCVCCTALNAAWREPYCCSTDRDTWLHSAGISDAGSPGNTAWSGNLLWFTVPNVGSWYIINVLSLLAFFVSLPPVVVPLIWGLELSYQFLPSDWQGRLLWGSLIMATGSSPESPGRRVRVLLCVCVVSCPYVM